MPTYQQRLKQQLALAIKQRDTAERALAAARAKVATETVGVPSLTIDARPEGTLITAWVTHRTPTGDEVIQSGQLHLPGQLTPQQVVFGDAKADR